MNSNSINEFLNRKATAVWVGLNTFVAYVISIGLPIVGANVEKWLKPFLEQIGAPEYLKTDFTVYGTVFGVCGVLTTLAIKRLIIIDARYNSEDAEKFRDVKRENKALKSKNKTLSDNLEKQREEHTVKLNDTIATCNSLKNKELGELQQKHQANLDRTIDDHGREMRRLRECLKLQEAAMDAMKNYKSVELDIREYNVSGGTRKMHMDD